MASNEPTDIDLTNTDWSLEYMNLGGVSHIVSGRKIPELSFEETALAADDGTNRARTTYELSGDSLSIGLIASTRMAYPEKGMPENALFEYLSLVETVVHHGELMHLKFAGGELVYRRLEESEPA